MQLETVATPSSSALQQTQLVDLLYPDVQTAYRRIRDLGIEAAPNEACGVLVKETLGCRVIQLTNRAEDPVNGYKIDGETLRQMELSPKTWAHVAIWHTHPGGMVGPSSGDLKHAVEGLKYLVVTVPTGEVVWFEKEA